MNKILCLRTQVGSERTLADVLSSRSIPSQAFIYQTFTEGDYPRRITKSLFPSYLFAGFEIYDHMVKLRQLPIKLRFHIIGQIEQEELAPVIDRIDSNTGMVVLDDGDVRQSRFIKGEQVYFTGGWAFGQEGFFESSTSDDERVMVLINLLGRPHCVPYDVRDMKRACEVYA